MANPPTKNSKAPNRKGNVTWAEMARDVLITAINRGQLPILGILVLLCIIVFRLPEPTLSTLASDILNALKAGELWSYIFLIITLLGWFAHSRYMRKQFSEEMRRVGKEKSELQNQKSNNSFQSSE